MFTFGFTTLIDLLSWTLVFALGLKLVVTMIILIVNKEMRDQPGWGSALWWVTKLTPLVAVACVAWIAILERERNLAWLSIGMALFVLVTVPLKVGQRRTRIAKRTSAKSLSHH